MKGNKRNRKGKQNADFRKLIAERMEEKRKVLKEKLQNKLKLIRDQNQRTSGLNNEPLFPAGAFERLRSNNIWEKVLEYLTDPNDVNSAYNACRTFSEILEKRRLLVLFSKALNVFKTKADVAYEAEKWKLGNSWYRNWERICMNSRLVSKAWKDVVDSHSDCAHNDWYGTIDWICPEDPRSDVYCDFWDEDSVDRAMSSLSSQSQCAPLRNVHVLFKPWTNELVLDKVIEFLQIHGRSVWFFKLEWDSPGKIFEVYEKFCEMLHCMGNLKGLELIYFVEDEAPEPEEIQNFQRRLNQRRFPVLNSLEHLDCSWVPHESLLSQILRKCVNLKSVDLSIHELEADETVEALMGLTLERFVGLAIIITSISNQVIWPLKHLEICDGRSVKASVLIPAINRFQETLQHLCIWEMFDMNAGNHCLNLPHLKQFHTCVMDATIGFDHLLQLKSLENVSVWELQGEKKNARVKIKRHLDKGTMDQSNIWQCFPNLISVRIGHWNLRAKTQFFLRPCRQ